MHNLSVDQLSAHLEKLVADRRARIAGAIVGGVVLITSMGLVIASKSGTRRLTTMASHLPAQPLNIPILRRLPEPQPMKARQPARIVTARR